MDLGHPRGENLLDKVRTLRDLDNYNREFETETR